LPTGQSSTICHLPPTTGHQLGMDSALSTSVPSFTMAGILRRLFPETIFARKLEPAAERRLRLAQARAEESIIRAHVDNALMFVDTLAEDLSFDRAIDTYVREMSIPEPLASIVATRTLVVLGQDLVPYRRRAQEADEEERPKLRLGEASEARTRSVKRA